MSDELELGTEGSPEATIEIDSGEFVAKDSNGNIVARRDESGGTWVLEGVQTPTTVFEDQTSQPSNVDDARVLYAKDSDGQLYKVNPDGTEERIGGGEWEEDGNGNIVPVDGETVGDGTTDANHETVNTDEAHTETIGASSIHYAGDFAGDDADARLDNALSKATGGDRIYLEAAEYTKDRTLSTTFAIVGAGENPTDGTLVNATWTANAADMFLTNFRLGDELIIDGFNGKVRGVVSGTGGIITVKKDIIRLVMLRSVDVIFESQTEGGIVDSSSGMTVTDNGNNTVGDIS